jgi:hypothetical protein
LNFIDPKKIAAPNHHCAQTTKTGLLVHFRRLGEPHFNQRIQQGKRFHEKFFVIVARQRRPGSLVFSPQQISLRCSWLTNVSVVCLNWHFPQDFGAMTSADLFLIFRNFRSVPLVCKPFFLGGELGLIAHHDAAWDLWRRRLNQGLPHQTLPLIWKISFSPSNGSGFFRLKTR